MTHAQRNSVVCWLSLNIFPGSVSSHPLFSVLALFLFFFAITCPAPGWVSLAPSPGFVLVVVYSSCPRASVQPLSSRLELGAIKISVLSTFHKVFWKSSPQNEARMGDTAWETQFQDNMCVLSWATCVCLPAGTRWWLIDLHHRYLQNKHQHPVFPSVTVWVQQQVKDSPAEKRLASSLPKLWLTWKRAV